MESLQKLTSAQMYVDHYYDQLKNELNSRGLQVSKVGMVGLLLHILGFTQMDIKQYFDTLFREAFVATADKYENLVMHGSVFGYIPGLATPANVVGYFEVNLNALPIAQNNVTRQIIIENLKVTVDEMDYTLTSQYLISGSNCQITDSGGKVTNVPFNTASPKLPIIDLVQYTEEEFSYTVPFYIFGSNYSKVITLNFTEGYICDIQIFVKDSESDEYIEYETRLVNYFTTSEEEVVFIKHLTNNKIQIDLGSGISGKYIPNSSIRVKVKVTNGEFGNISKQTAIPSAGIFRVYDNSTENSNSFSVPIGRAINTQIDYADGGTNSLNSEELRDAILSFIRSRNSMMSENDFYELLEDYIPDFILLFKKTHVVENVIYCFAPFRNKYQLPIRSQSISVKHQNFNPGGECYVYKPLFTINGEEYISPFLYAIDYLMRYYKGYIVHESVSNNFTNIINEQKDPETGIIPADSLSTLPLTMYTVYNPTLDNTRFLVQSYENIDDYVFYIDIPVLEVYDVCMTSVTQTLQEYYYYNNSEGSGLIFEEIDISVKVYKDSKHIFTYNLNNFKMIDDISDLLTLKTFDGFVDYDDTGMEQPNEDGSLSMGLAFDDDAYVLNIPIMRYNEFNQNEDFYIQKFVNTFSVLSINNNRMISDDVQIRFLNTDDVDADIVKAVTKQNYDMRLQLPLRLSVDIVANKKKIKDLNINTVDVEKEIKFTLADTLFNNYTGTHISFYRTQIVDIIHNFEWVKYCDVYVHDNLSHQIPNANIELNEQDDIVSGLDKLGAITYCPVFIWWDLDNIIINIEFE